MKDDQINEMLERMCAEVPEAQLRRVLEFLGAAEEFNATAGPTLTHSQIVAMRKEVAKAILEVLR